MSERHRIVAIVQIHNEIRRGNLVRFFSHLQPHVDAIVAYDDGSVDGSWTYIQQHATRSYRGVGNTFTNERRIRERLLREALELKPDFILWLDADETLDARAGTALQAAAQFCLQKNADGVALHEVNPWRSPSWKRVDNQYNEGWFVRLWRVTPRLAFKMAGPGLHQQLYPESIQRIERFSGLSVIHYGFYSAENILYKYLNYQRHGQSGWALQRLIDESTLALEPIENNLLPADQQLDAPKPKPLPLQWWLYRARELAPELLRPKVSIVALIYKSTMWAKFCYEQVLKHTNMHDVEFFFVANDATDGVKKYLRSHYIPHYLFENREEEKKEWYINNVYRAWNFSAKKARGEYVIFINSDMAFTPGWVDKLLAHATDENCITARLIESGKMRSGKYGIEKNFGQNLRNFREQDFQHYAAKHVSEELRDGGLFMPLLIKREYFIGVGGYPEGNVVPGSDPFSPKIAKQNEPMLSGDVVLMNKLLDIGIHHKTAFDVFSYHFQEGEMDDAETTKVPNGASTAIVNDWLTGRMGERTMWNELVAGLPNTVGLDQQVCGKGNIAQLASQWLRRQGKKVQVLIQNASFMDVVKGKYVRIVYLQDDLRRMGTSSHQQEENLRTADFRVTNSLLTAQSYPEYNFTIIPIGVNQELFQPQEKNEIRNVLGLPSTPIAIFVGDLSPVKGWEKIQKIIESRSDVHWIIVSKSNEIFTHPNVTMFNKVDQQTLAKLYSAADVFVLGSPIETQCLAAIEAGLCNTPIVMNLTGIFWEMPEAARDRIGRFGENIDALLTQVLQDKQSFSPRKELLAYGVNTQTMLERWYTLLQSAHQQSIQSQARQNALPHTLRISIAVKAMLSHGVQKILSACKAILKFILPTRWADALARLIYKS